MSNGCPYCQKQLSLINQRNIDVATNAYIDGDILFFSTSCDDFYYDTDEQIEINYCPICGCNLKEHKDENN